MADSNQVLLGLGEIINALSQYLIPLAAASGLTVALLEAYKKLFSIQGRFHRRAITRWLLEASPPVSSVADVLAPLHGKNHYAVPKGQRAAFRVAQDALRAQAARSSDGDDDDDEVVKAGPSVKAYHPGHAFAELHHLTTGLVYLDSADTALVDDVSLRFRSVGTALFELELSRMMSQIQDASDAALNNPSLYPSLFVFLTRGCQPGDVAAWRRYMSRKSLSEHSPQEDAKVMAEVYGRIRLLVRRQLDGFQVVTARRWEDLNQLWAMAVGAVVLFTAQLITSSPNGLNQPIHSVIAGVEQAQQSSSLVHMILYSLLGGVLAPIAKDLINALSGIGLGKGR